jgi:hypothetical protein
VSGAYQAGGAVKLGTSSGSGSITSKPLDLSGNGGKFSVQFDVKGWTTVEGDISISVTGLTTQTVSYTALRTGSFETKTVSFTGGTANSTVTIATTAKRAFIDNVSILTQSSGGTGAPTVVTGTTSGITSNAATLGGTISAIGAGNATERGFYWSTTSGFANGTGTKVSTTGSFSSGAYTQNVTGLTSSTTYYYKAFATGPGGTGYGAQATWTTLGTATPALTLSPAALSAFTTAFGTPSASQSFTVSGSALTASVTLSAPSGFELATASAGPYAASLSLTPSSGTLASTTIFVRLSATASGSPSGSITASSAGATSQTKAVSGTVSGGGGGGTASLLAGWDFQTTSNGGTAVRASPNTPTAFVANFGTGTLYLNATNGSSNWATASELNGFGGTAVNAGTGFSTSTTTPASLALVGSSANSKSIVFKVNMTGQKDLIISYATQDSGTGFSSHTWARSTDATTWTTVQTISSIPSSFATQTLPAISALNGVANAYLRLTVAGASSTSGNNRLDNIQFTATPSASGPTIAASGTLAALDTAYGTPTPAPGSFSLAGNSLTAGITLTPPAGFELSSAGPVSGYAGSGVPITIGTAGDVASTTIYIRLAASAPVGTYSGNVVCSSSGATSVNVPTVSSAMSKAPLFVSAADATRVYGAQNPSFVLSYTGFVNGQSETVLTSLPLASTSATVSSPPGIYSIVVSGGSAANYAFSYVNGELSVSAAPLPSNEILFSPPPSFIQDSTAKTFTVTSSKAQSFSVIYRGRKATRYGPSIEAPIVAGDYLVTATSTDANYEGTASVEFSIFASAFAQWLAGYPLATDVSPGGDPDHDGLPNLMEYFMGLDPSQNDALNAFTPERAGQIWSLVYRRSKTATGVTGAVTWTADPAAVVPWSSSGITDSLVSDQGIYEIRKASLNAGSSPGARFLHLEVLP